MLMVFLPILVTGVFYIVGAMVQKRQKEEQTERIERAAEAGKKAKKQ